MRKILYMATVTAIRHNPTIRDFHTRLCAKGKPKKVALVAAMRKRLTVLNAVSRDQVPWTTEPLSTGEPVHWQWTAEDARTKLLHLHPTFE